MRLVLAIGALAVLAGLPFVVLVRGAVHLFAEGWPTWLAVAGGALGAWAVVALYLAPLVRWPGRGWGLRLRSVAGIAALAVGLYAGSALLTLADTRAKTAEVRQTYRALHPILRLATSTWMLVDPDLLVTDTARTPDDYRRMGLPPLDRSLHYQQPATGYVHALDLRTHGRAEWRNALTERYHRAMGLRTLRHGAGQGGTADHLHIGLPVP